MPPPMITNVMPMLTTPMVAASRRIVSALSVEVNRSPAVIAPTMQISSSATTSPALRPTLVRSRARTGLASRSVSSAACSTRALSWLMPEPFLP